MCEYHQAISQGGDLKKKREQQMHVWMWRHIHERMMEIFRKDQTVAKNLSELENMVSQGIVTPGLAADILLEKFLKKL